MSNAKDAAAIRRKYRMDDPPQPNNRVVDRILAGQQLLARTFGDDLGELFDPARSPRIYEIARASVDHLHAGLSSGEIRRETHDDTVSDPLDPIAPFSADSPALYVHIVGTDYATVCRGAKRLSAFERATHGRVPLRRDVDYFEGMYQVMMQLHDEFWDRPCNVNIASNCGAHDGPCNRPRARPRLLPYLAGTVMLIFEICPSCLEYAMESAQVGFELSTMEARLDLPSDAVIDFGGPSLTG